MPVPVIAEKKLSPSEARNKAMSHGDRRAILRHYVERGPKAPVEVAHELGMDISKTSYHTRTLVDLGILELIGTEPKRGSTKHYYRATDRHLVDESEWERLDPIVREGVLGDVFQPQIDDFTRAVKDGILGRDGQFHLTRVPVRAIDQKGKGEMLAAHMRLYKETAQIEARAAERMAESGEKPIAVSSGQSCFEVGGF